MKELKNAKQEYEQITIPKELSERVALEIKRAEKQRAPKRQKPWALTLKKATAAAAVLVVTFGIGVNVSPAFAETIGNVPIIGEFAKVLTIQKYQAATDDYVIDVEIPTIDMISEDFADLEESINKEIYAICEQYAEESKANALEYRNAFLETGGTLEEWQAHDINIKVWYVVQIQTDEYLSLAVHRAESWNSASAETKLFNINLQTGQQVSMDEVVAATGTAYYEDVYAVPAEAAAIHGNLIKETVANNDLEKLTDLTAYPVYIGLDEGLVIETKEDFMALGAERIFTDELIDSITTADVSNLVASRVGFYISADNESPSIGFTVVDGQLKINGINY